VGDTAKVSEMIVVKRCVKYPMAPSLAQADVLDRQTSAARALWNLIHAHHTFYEGSKRWPSWTESDTAIWQARKDIDWLAVLPAQAAQQVLKAYKQAWLNYWNGTHGRPTWKTRRARRAVDVPQARDLNLTPLNGRWATVAVPKVGAVKVRLHRATPERVTGARVVREATGWMLVVRGENRMVKPRQRRAERGGQRENQALFRCADPACGWTGNADTNAAIVIKHRGQEVAAQDVEPNATRQATKRQNPKTAT
jgi:putative transposase